MSQMTEAQAAELLHNWKFWGRPSQLAPAGSWSSWLMLAGRGFGKTRAGAEWVRSKVCGTTPLAKGAARRVALVAETAADARDVIVEGDSGILAVHPADFRPLYEPSKRRLTWPNGAVAHTYNAREPGQLRGPQHDLAWSDELAKWRYADETWDMLQFGLRLGDNPQQIITTTPRPIKIVRDLIKDTDCVTTYGSTYENEHNLSKKFIARMRSKYEGTRLGRQELHAHVLDDAPDALWQRQNFDYYRKKENEVPTMQRIVIAIDPAAKKNEQPEEGAATGIVAVGLGEDGRGYVLEDGTVRASPNGWARRAVALYDRFSADTIVGETNNGGEMVKETVRSVRPGIPFIEVHASKGKWTRAEPASALYEQGRVSHVGSFAALEDEMVLFGPNGIVDGTADRVDALVWALAQLFPQIIAVRQPKEEDDHVPAIVTGAGGWMG